MVLSSCSDDDETVAPSVDPPNVLLIIADDLGKDALNGFRNGTAGGAELDNNPLHPTILMT
jgi:hypothetical protein